MSEPDGYCREVEAHLCRKNDGHLIRIVGPAFELVSGWARQGIPLKVACAGIDRYLERYYRRGPRRRPVRVEFCEADVLDAFDGWRRAVGVGSATPRGGAQAGESEDAEAGSAGPARRGLSLASHVQQALARVTILRGSREGARPADGTLADIARALDGLQARAPGARGSVREELIAHLAVLDLAMLTAARAALEPGERQRLEAEAAQQLQPFRPRMPAGVYERSLDAAVNALLRDRLGLPKIAFE